MNPSPWNSTVAANGDRSRAVGQAFKRWSTLVTETVTLLACILLIAMGHVLTRVMVMNFLATLPVLLTTALYANLCCPAKMG